MTDKELAKKIESGDGEAADQFVRDHYPAVLRLATRLSGQKEDGEDIAQQTFMVARRKIGSFRGNSSLRTWIHRIAINETRQWRRRTVPVANLNRDVESQDSGIEEFESGHILSAAMANLPEKQREAFVLFEVEQLPMNEVAQVLGVPSGTAKARVFYARQNLRRQLEGRTEVIRDEFQESTR